MRPFVLLSAAVAFCATITTTEAQEIQLPTFANCATPAVSIGAADETNTDLLHTLLATNWKGCTGTITFTEPGAVFALPGGYVPSGNLILDASGLASPVTLTATEGVKTANFFAFTAMGSAFVAKNIVFANIVRTVVASSGATVNAAVLFMDKGMASFENCRFVNNMLSMTTAPGTTPSAGGGALRLGGSSFLRFEDCSFEGNAVVTQSRIGNGGAVSITEPRGPVIFNRCSFLGNKVNVTYVASNAGKSQAAGGAVFFDYTNQTASQPVTFTSCVFQNNEARGAPNTGITLAQAFYVCGGAVAMDPNPAKASLLDFTYSNCSFVQNTATGDSWDTTFTTTSVYVFGGAVSHTYGSATFSSSTFRENTAASSVYTTASNTVMIRTVGGAVHTNGVAATMDSCSFQNNTVSAAVDGRGGGFGATLSNGPTLTTINMINTSLISNKVVVSGAYGKVANGGGNSVACSPNAAHTCRFTATAGSSWTENSATISGTTLLAAQGPFSAQGGGMFLAGMSSQGASLTDVNFSGNQVYGGAGGPTFATPLNVEGGGFYLLDSAVSATGAEFIQNKAKMAATNTAANSLVDGGGLTIARGTATAPKVNLTRATFRDNTAGGIKRYFGGALFNYFNAVLVVDVETSVWEMDLAQFENLADTSFNEYSYATATGTTKVTTVPFSTKAPTTEPTAVAATADVPVVTMEPSAAPTPSPTSGPTKRPTLSPSPGPTAAPTPGPTMRLTSSPSPGPTETPTGNPSAGPTFVPTHAPTPAPSPAPTRSPSQTPTLSPTVLETKAPVAETFVVQSAAAAAVATPRPTKKPRTKRPTRAPIAKKTKRPTKRPTRKPRTLSGATGYQRRRAQQ